MMDNENVVSNQQSIAAVASAILSDKSIDMGASDTLAPSFQAIGTPFHDWGRGTPVHCYVKVTEAVSTGSSPTVACALVMADDGALTSNLTVLMDSGAIAAATLVVGYEFRLGTLPPGITKRYIGFRYTIGTATTTTGKVFAAFLVNRPSIRVTSAGA